MTNIKVRLAGVRIWETEGYSPNEPLRDPEGEPHLPPGATQVEYFELLPKQLFALEFSNADLPRIQKLLIEHGLDPASCIVPLRADVTVHEYRLIIPESFLGILPSHERTNAHIYVPPTQMLYQAPILYRFIKQPYAKELLENGRIRISSFERCRKQEGGCGDRFDQGEGLGVFAVQTDDYTAEFSLQVGGNPLMLCMALSSDARKADDDICIEILDLFSLIDAISTGLTEKGIIIKRVMHGPCTYADRLFVRKCVKSRHVLESLLNQIASGTVGIDYHLCGEIPLTEIGDRHYFTKPKSFSDEHEYRIVWDCENVPEDGKIDIVIKDVQSFCRLHE